MQRVPLTQGRVALIDDADLEPVNQYKWSAHHAGDKWYAYAWVRGGGGKRILLHQLLMQPPPGLEVDHINGDGLDCRRGNMRLATKGQNAANRGPRRCNTSGFKGVFASGPRRWRAQVRYQDRTVYLGSYATPEEAAWAYDAFVLLHLGEFAWTNRCALRGHVLERVCR